MTGRSLAELHAAYPYDQDEHYWRGEHSLSEVVDRETILHLVDDPVGYLDNIRDKDFSRSMDIHQALRFLPPEVVIRELGKDIALWVSVGAGVQGHNDDINTALHKEFDLDLESLKIAGDWHWDQPQRYMVKPILAEYDLMQALKNGALDTIDLPTILENSAREGVTLSASRIDDYALIPVEHHHYSVYYKGGAVSQWNVGLPPDVRFFSWLDTPSGFALTYKGVPNALAGVARTDSTELKIHQLQGVQRKKVDPLKSVFDPDRVVGEISSRGLMPLDWQKVMIGVAEEIARRQAVPRAAILSGENNVWTKPRLTDGLVHLPLERAQRAYDAVADRLGYTHSEEDRKDWFKDLH